MNSELNYLLTCFLHNVLNFVFISKMYFYIYIELYFIELKCSLNFVGSYILYTSPYLRIYNNRVNDRPNIKYTR